MNQNPYAENQFLIEQGYKLDEKGQIICGANAYLNETNKQCFCKDEFPFGDPFMQKGCFKCNNTCSQFATCEYPGNCNCNGEYEGNGIKCIKPFPNILFLKRLNKSFIRLDINYYSDDELKQAYCKVGEKVVKSTNFSNTFIECNIGKTGVDLDVSISKDGKIWSPVSAYHLTNEDNVDNKPRKTLLVVLFILFMTALTIFMSQAKAPLQEEVQPFIKPKERKRLDLNDQPSERQNFAKL